MIQSKRKYKHVCPKNCASSCTFVSEINDTEVAHINGDTTHPYTKGKLCQKGFSFRERNEHPSRLKHPLYQKKKGSNKFTKISWEKAYELICNELINIELKYGDFTPAAFYKGSGNIGIHHNVTDEFFSYLNGTKIIGGANIFQENDYMDTISHLAQPFDENALTNASTIIIWGANPAATNIHLIPYLIDAKLRGTKLVVIDPIVTKTADFADLFIQLRPNTDLQLACLLTKHIVEKGLQGNHFVDQHQDELHNFITKMKDVDEEQLMKQCDIPEKAMEQLLSIFDNGGTISYILGNGLQKYNNSKHIIEGISTLAMIYGNRDENHSTIFFKNNNLKLFNNQLHKHANTKHINEILSHGINEDEQTKFLWITCANPLQQELNVNEFKRWMESIPFVVVVDHFLTDTGKMANLILPTTTFFEETDLVISPWHHALALNEQAISPYANSRSEWKIMTDLAHKLQKRCSKMEGFPIYENEEQYLNNQLNEQVSKYYSVNNIDDLQNNGNHVKIKKHHIVGVNESTDRYLSAIPFHFNIKEANLEMNTYDRDEFTFTLITPHHPYKLNSQFHYLDLSAYSEATIEINSSIAKELQMKDGEIVTLYNELGSIEIKAAHNRRVPRDVILFYPGSYPKSSIALNELTGNHSHSAVPSFYDTTVHIKKL